MREGADGRKQCLQTASKGVGPRGEVIRDFPCNHYEPFSKADWTPGQFGGT